MTASVNGVTGLTIGVYQSFKQAKDAARKQWMDTTTPADVVSYLIYDLDSNQGCHWAAVPPELLTRPPLNLPEGE